MVADYAALIRPTGLRDLLPFFLLWIEQAEGICARRRIFPLFAVRGMLFFVRRPNMQPASERLEERVTSLERELRKIKTELRSVKKASQKPWWGHVAGRFKNDPLFDETIKAGQKYRRSLKPRTR